MRISHGIITVCHLSPLMPDAIIPRFLEAIDFRFDARAPELLYLR